MESNAALGRPLGRVEERSPALAKRPRIGEIIIEALLLLAGVASIGTTIGIVYVLVRDAYDFFALPEVTLVEFFTSTTWLPQNGSFGIWPLLNATLIVSGISLLVSLPIGLATAVYLSEYATPVPEVL